MQSVKIIGLILENVLIIFMGLEKFPILMARYSDFKARRQACGGRPAVWNVRANVRRRRAWYLIGGRRRPKAFFILCIGLSRVVALQHFDEVRLDVGKDG